MDGNEWAALPFDEQKTAQHAEGNIYHGKDGELSKWRHSFTLVELNAIELERVRWNNRSGRISSSSARELLNKVKVRQI